jgi:hypothetical protein
MNYVHRVYTSNIYIATLAQQGTFLSISLTFVQTLLSRCYSI